MRRQTVHSVNGGPPLTLEAGELLFLNQHATHQVERAGMEDVGVNFIVLPQFSILPWSSPAPTTCWGISF